MTTHPSPNPTVVVEEIDDDICLYRSDIDEVLVLNQTAADVWRLADGSVSVEELIALLASSYGSHPDDLRTDVVTVLADLRQRGYLE